MLVQRIITGIVLGTAIVVAILFLPSLWAGIVLGGLWLVGGHEWSKIAGLSRVPASIFVLLLAAAMLLASRVIAVPEAFIATLVIALLWWLIAVALLLTYPRQISRISTIIAGIAVLLPAWALLTWLHNRAEDGPWLLLTMLAIVWSADVGAYGFGRVFGRHKLAPQVSPGKTWEGVAGGVLLASVAGAIASTALSFSALQLSMLAAATALISVVGDLTVSMFKRNAGVKDSGSLLPGHGGVLDRIDSVTPAVALFVAGLVGMIT